MPIAEAVEDMRGTVDDVVLVSDDHIVDAMRLLFDHAGLLIEPASATGVAAILAGRERYRGRRAATIVCGSNVTAADAARWFLAAG